MSGILVLILQLASLVFLARAILSWLRIGEDSSLYGVWQAIYRLTEPVLAPIRGVVPMVGGIDISVFIVILGINFVLVPIASRL
jgi:YggT family protein